MSNIEVAAMKYDQRKIEEVVIALLGTLEFEDGLMSCPFRDG